LSDINPDIILKDLKKQW